MIADKIFTSVYSTYDYNKFNMIKTNRAINQSNVKEIITSMEEEQLVIPIIVNEKFEIIDGQHRFSVCAEKQLPVYYIQMYGYAEKQILLANNFGGKDWDDMDYLNQFLQLEKEDYLEIKKILEKYKISITVYFKLISYINNDEVGYKEIKKKFRMGEPILDYNDTVAEILDDLEIIDDLTEFDFMKTPNFIYAFAQLWLFPPFKIQYLQRGIKSNAHLLDTNHQNLVKHYLSSLVKVYQRGLKNKGETMIYYSIENNKLYIDNF